MIIDPNDKKYFVKNPGKDFSPARNKAIIQETIQETEQYFKLLNEIKDEDGLNRIDILSSYGRARLGGSTQKDFESWAGKDLTRALIGEKILEKVRIADSTNKLRGNRKHSILL